MEVPPPPPGSASLEAQFYLTLALAALHKFNYSRAAVNELY